MVRTQIYLTEAERDGLQAIAKSTNRKQSALIREALDQYLDLHSGIHRKTILKEAAGMWSKRRDLPDFTAMRRSWDRG